MATSEAPPAPQVDEERLVEFLATQPDVVAAYLFGSVARGQATPHSDVDIALLLREADRETLWERRLQLMGELERFGDRVDVVVLNLAPLLLQHRVLSEGRLLYEGDRSARVEFEVRVGKRYADYRPTLEFFKQALFQEIREGRLGGRR